MPSRVAPILLLAGLPRFVLALRPPALTGVLTFSPTRLVRSRRATAHGLRHARLAGSRRATGTRAGAGHLRCAVAPRHLSSVGSVVIGTTARVRAVAVDDLAETRRGEK